MRIEAKRFQVHFLDLLNHGFLGLGMLEIRENIFLYMFRGRVLVIPIDRFRDCPIRLLGHQLGILACDPIWFGSVHTDCSGS